MIDQEQRLKRARARDVEAIELLALRGVTVGQIFNRSINQADRHCRVFAVSGKFYAYDYEMPAGEIFYRIGNTHRQAERTVSAARLPGWAKAALEVSA
jgi:hypothetical protein